MRGHQSERRSSLLAAAAFAAGIVFVAGCVRFVPEQPKPPAEVVQGGDKLRANDIAGARKQYAAAIKKNPSDPGVYIQIMASAASSGKPELAAEYFRRGESAVAGEPAKEKGEYYLSAGSMLDHAGDAAGAMKAYEEAYRHDPKNPWILNNLGYSYAQAGQNLQRAVELTTKAIQLAKEQNVPDERLGFIVDSLGWAYYRNGQYHEAIRTLATAADMTPGNPEIHYHLGMAYQKRDRYNDAQVELLRAKASLNAKEHGAILTQRLEAAINKALEEVKGALESRGETAPGDTEPTPADPPGARSL